MKRRSRASAGARDSGVSSSRTQLALRRPGSLWVGETT